MRRHVMLDLETLGTRPGCAILSIGAVEFNPASGKLGPEFYEVINRKSCAAKGLHEDEKTIEWWNGRSDEARKILAEVETCPQGLGGALVKFSGWLQQFGKKDLQVWGCGADFDQPIIAACFHVVSMPLPWMFYNNRCYRTLRAIGNMKGEPPRHGTYHHALDDAKTQAYNAITIAQKLRLSL